VDELIKRLEKYLEKDSIVARNWGEDGVSIDGDIELAIDTIKHLRHLTNNSSRAAKTRAIRDCQHIFKQPGCKGCWGIPPPA